MRISLSNLGFRIVVLMPYVFIASWYFQHNPSNCTFIGMPRLTQFAGESSIALNIPALSFMLFGLTIPLEQFSDHLCHPNWMIAIRRRRTWTRFAGYLTVVMAYSALFTIPQLILSVTAVPHADVLELTSGACYAWWSLVITLAIANIGYMADSRAIGYAAAMIPHLAFVGVPELWAALITALPKTTVPRWTAVLALLTIVTIAINAIVFSHNDIR